MTFRFVGPNIASAAEDGHDVTSLLLDRQLYLLPRSSFILDIDGNAIAVVGSDGNSNELFKLMSQDIMIVSWLALVLLYGASQVR